MGKITGKPDQFDGKNYGFLWFPVDFPNKTNPVMVSNTDFREPIHGELEKIAGSDPPETAERSIVGSTLWLWHSQGQPWLSHW